MQPGTRLGPYEILGAIGAEGMGEVYRAKDTRLDRSVAIRVLPPGLSGDAERRARMEREARSLAALAHPRICRLLDDLPPVAVRDPMLDLTYRQLTPILIQLI